MKGFFNRLLRIDLTRRQFSYDTLADSVLECTLGGKGLGSYLLMKENPAGVDPFSPANRFIIAVGPVTGTRMWSQSRFAVFSKSPATGGYGESYCGGSVAPKIKACGVDAIIIHGQCDRLTSLLIDENGVTFKNAAALQGADTVVTEETLLRDAPEGAGAIMIGPAGENRVAFACIKSDRWRSLGRGGMGAVLGAKHLKGVVFCGQQTCAIADNALLKKVIMDVAKMGQASPATERYRKLGTPMQVAMTNSQKCFPTRYWQSGVFEKWKNLSAGYMQKHFEVTAHGCPNCFLKCTKLSTIKAGRHQGLQIEGPEYETIFALGGLNAIDSLEEVAWLNDICDRLGLDTMSAGNISSFAVEAYKAGQSNFAIDYNQPDRAAELFGLIARGEGVGQVFGQGIKVTASTLGLEDMAIHVKGLEPAGFDPRVLKGMGLSYATSARGACHLRGTFYKAELSGEIDCNQIKGKAAVHIDYEDRAALVDSLILCRFFRDFTLWPQIRELIQATTGLALDKRRLELLANATTERTRAYNRREGLSSATDTLPRRFFKEKTEEGIGITEDELKTMIAEYNAIRTQRLTEYSWEVP